MGFISSIFTKIKAVIDVLSGNYAGLVKFGLEVFNQKVLAKIPSKEAGVKYIKDAQATCLFLQNILDNHADDFSEKRKLSVKAIISAIEELAKALEDFEVDTDELDTIIATVKEAIDLFKKSKNS